MDWVTVDWDDDSPAKDMLAQATGCLSRLPDPLRPLKVMYRHSSSGRWHLRLIYRGELNQEERFQVREIMGDDGKRILWDRARVKGEAVVDYSHGILYDLKGSQDRETGDIVLQEAGEWRRLPW